MARLSSTDTYKNRGSAYNARGYKALRAGHAARALTDFTRAVGYAPKRAGKRHSLGEGYFYSGDEEKAKQVWRKACNLAAKKKATDWQKRLAKVGYYSGEIDGICGSGSGSGSGTIAAFASCARAKCEF
ncbi:MAG: hypothetical protein GY927_14765 [bacterium]|nr:hypothetical protein [bacterium]